MTPPYDLLTFNHLDPVQLQAMREWAGWNWGELARRMTVAGRPFSDSGLTRLARKFGLPSKSAALNGTVAPVTVIQRAQVEDASAARDTEFREFMEWLDNRKLRVQTPPRMTISDTTYLKALVGGDLHFPLHDEGYWNVFLALADHTKPDVLGLNGDTLDLAQLSKYPQNPSFYRSLQEDLDKCRDQVFGRVNACVPDAEKWINLGNHEWGRWQRYLWTKAPAIASLRCLEWEALLGLAEVGWNYNPHEWWAGDSCIVYHGERHTNQLGGGSAMSARKEMLDMGALSGLTNHTHHGGMFLRKNRSGYYVWYENGLLGSPEKMQEAGVTGKDQPTKPEDWHPGCSIISFRPGHSAFHVEWIPILRDRKRTFLIYHDEEIAA